MSAALYLATAIGLLFAADRWLIRIPRWTALVVLLLPMIFTGRALLIDGLFGPFDLPYNASPLADQRAEHGVASAYNGMLSDLYTQIIPYRKAVHDALANGEWPLWNPYTLSGEPLAAEAQPAVYSPFTLLALLLPVAKSFTYTAALWFFIAALATYLFSRDLGCGEMASLFAGAAFMCASGLVFFILWPLGQTWALLPFVFLAVRRLSASPWPLLIALTLVVLSGHPESVLHIVFVGAAYAIFQLAMGQPRVAVLRGIAAGALTLGICAIYLLPFMEATKQTEEYIGRKAVYAQTDRSVPPGQSLTILLTDVLAATQQRTFEGIAPFYTASVGSIALALCIYALWRVRGAEKWFFAGLLAFCLLAHARTFVEAVLQHLPLFDIAVNDRLSYAAAFAFVVLAAFGLDQLQRDRDVIRFAICGTITLIFVTVASLDLERAGIMRPNIERWGEYRFFADVAFLGIALLIVLARPRIALLALLACLLLQRAVQEADVYPTFSADVAYPPIRLFSALKRVDEPFRVTGVGMTFLPGTNAFYGLEDVRGYTPMTLRRYRITYDLWCRAVPVFVNVIDNLRPFLSFLNVRYAIVNGGDVPAHWHEVGRYRTARLLENDDVVPRASVPAVVHVGSQAQLMEMSLADDVHNHVWIETHDVMPHTRVNGPGTVRLTRRKRGFDIDADMQGDGWVVVSEAAWNGWRAYIDGRRVHHQFANIAFIGIYVPAGKHAIQLIYWPDSFLIGRDISAATLLGIAIFVIARRRRASRGTALRSDRS